MNNIKGKERNESSCLRDLQQLGIDIYQKSKKEHYITEEPVIKKEGVQSILDRYCDKHNLSNLQEYIPMYYMDKIINREKVEIEDESNDTIVLKDLLSKHPLLNSFKKISSTNEVYPEKAIVITSDKIIGNKTWGKIEYLVNNHNYKLVRE